MPSLGLLTGTEKGLGGSSFPPSVPPNDAPYTPQLPLRNMYAVNAVTEPTQFALVSREPLRYRSSTVFSNDATRQSFEKDGVLDGFAVHVFGSTYSGSSDTALGGSLVPSIAGNSIGVVITAGEDVLFDDGTTVRSVSFPDGAHVTKVLESQGRFIFIRADSQRFYWTQPLANMLDGSGDIVIDGLDFASAEDEPDELLDGLIYKSMLVLFGKETVEIHAPTGNDDLPWAAIVGSTIDEGILSTGCAALWNGTFAWIAPDYTVNIYSGSGKKRVSNEGIERVIRLYGVERLDSFNYRGHEFLRVWMDFDSDYPDLLLDAQTMQWCEWASGTGAFLGGPVVEKTGGDLTFWRKDLGRPMDMGANLNFGAGSPETADMEYSFRAGLPMDGGGQVIHNILLRCQTGLSGDTIEMRFSRDKGTTWSSWKSLTLAGERQKIEWRSLGLFDQPGALFEFRTVGAQEFAVSGAMYNEPVMGRGRG